MVRARVGNDRKEKERMTKLDSTERVAKNVLRLFFSE